MKIILISVFTFVSSIVNGQVLYPLDGEPTSGFIFCNGIMWTETRKQDSVLKIIIQGDTMSAIRNLLEYCLQEKEENEYSSYVLNRINLEYLAKTFKDKEFNFYLKEYKKVKAKNQQKRDIKYPQYAQKTIKKSNQ